MKKAILCFCALAALFFSFGCGTRHAAMANFQSVSVTNGNILKGIRYAALSRNWLIDDRTPGVVRCTMNKGTHQVVVDVIYSQTEFYVTYVSSVDMRYDPVTQTISPKYNQWVNNLIQDIQKFAMEP